MLSNTQLCRDFLQMEEELDLFRQTIDGVYFWEHVRFYVFLEVQRRLGLADNDAFQQANPWWRWSGQVLASLAGLATHNPFITKPKTTFFFGCPRRTPDKDGTWWDTTVDPFLDALDVPAFYLERYCGGRHCTPPRTRDVKYHDMFSMVACGYRVATFSQRFSTRAAALLREVESHLEKRFRVRIDLAAIALPILKTRRSLWAMYKLLLERVRPRAVFVASINYYERIGIEVCKTLGIPVVELQHGVIGPFDLCYVYPRNAPLRCFPDYLYVYGPFWKACVDFPLPPERIVSIGNPYLEARRAEHRGTKKTNEVVVISQPTVGAALSRFAVELKARTDFTNPIIYRLHPRETDWQARYPWLREAGITVSESRDGDIHQLLARAQTQIGVYSAAIVEGLAYGLNTYLVNLTGVEYLRPILDRNWATLVNSPQEIRPQPGRHMAEADETFCAGNSLERFRAALAKLLMEEAPRAGVPRAA